MQSTIFYDQLADSYDLAGQELYRAASDLEKAAKLLRSNRPAQAEGAIKSGLDRLTLAIDRIPRAEQETQPKPRPSPTILQPAAQTQ